MLTSTGRPTDSMNASSSRPLTGHSTRGGSNSDRKLVILSLKYTETLSIQDRDHLLIYLLGA
jgi:hypothetical protein